MARKARGFEGVGEALGDVVDVLIGEAEVLGVLAGFVGEEEIAGEADVLSADEEVGEADGEDDAHVDGSRRF